MVLTSLAFTYETSISHGRARVPTGVAAEVVGMEEERTRSDLSAPARSRGDERAAAAAAAALGVRVEDREQEAHEMTGVQYVRRRRTGG